MSLPYSEFPVYIGGIGTTALPSEVNGYIPATKASVNYNTNHSPKRKLGTTIDSTDQLGFQQALSADISIDCVFHTGMLSGLDFFKRCKSRWFCYYSIGQWSVSRLLCNGCIYKYRPVCCCYFKC